jgi:signal transduction histidine kinase
MTADLFPSWRTAMYVDSAPTWGTASGARKGIMLSRLKVRTKLLAILLPLLLGIVGLAGLGVRDRINAQRRAEHTLTLLQMSSSISDLVHNVQLEELQAVATQIGSPAPGVSLTKLQHNTDASITEFQPLVDDFAQTSQPIDTQTPAQVVADIRRQLSDIPQAREMVTPSGGTVLAVADNYSGVVDALVQTSAHLLQSTNGGTDATAVHWLSAAKATDARLATDIAAIIGATRTHSLTDATWAVQESGELLGQSHNFAEVFTTDADDFGRQVYDKVLQNPDYAASQAAYTELGSIDPNVGLSTPMASWITQSMGRLAALHTAEQRLHASEIAAARDEVATLNKEVRLFLGGSATALLLALFLAATVTRSITSNLRRLTDAAKTISTEQLPRLVDSMHSPNAEATIRPTDIEVKSQDEFAELATAFGAVEQAAIDVAAEQSRTLRKGISDIFVNLARRNQSLLDRQIEFIDRLEANEEDPDQLENLFRLDHLATRMRRNAESLLVLAQAEGPRRRAKAVSVSDIVRVAVGEVEDFARITLLAIDDAIATGSAAVDVAHLLAELMENGTQYSPPERKVEVVGHRDIEGGYVLTVSDRGVGMSPEAMAEANVQLATPPAVGLSLSRSLGFIVVATLAARHSIRVSLTESPSGGVTAVVTLPAALILSSDDQPGGITGPQAPPAVREPVAPTSGAPVTEQNWAYSNFDDWTAAGADPSTVGTSTDETEPAEAQSVDPLATQETSPLEAPVDWAEPAGWTAPAIVSEPTSELVAGAASIVADPAPAYESSVVFPDMGSTGGSGGTSADWAEPPADEPVAEHGDANETEDGEGEVYWSAEIVDAGEPDVVPNADSPMGSAFQLGVAALLSQNDGSILGVPTSPFQQQQQTSADDPTDLVIDSTSTDTDEVVTESIESTDGVEDPNVVENDGSPSTPPLAAPPFLETGRMRRTTMWQARVEPPVEEQTSTEHETGEQTTDASVEAASAPADEPELDEPQTATGMFGTVAPEATSVVDESSVAAMSAAPTVDPSSTTDAVQTVDPWAAQPVAEVADVEVKEVPWAPLPRRDDPPVEAAAPTPEPVPAAAAPPQPGGELNEFGLPKRAPRKASPTQELVGDKLVTTPRRPAEEIRSILSSYRSGLTSGRDGTEAPAESPTEQPAPQRNPNQRGNDEPTQF